MSLVGPRPCLPSQAELVGRRAARNVLALRPGITGLSQVEGIDMSDPDRLARRDADYAALRCLSLDLWLIARTLTGGGRGDRTAAGSVSGFLRRSPVRAPCPVDLLQRGAFSCAKTA